MRRKGGEKLDRKMWIHVSTIKIKTFTESNGVNHTVIPNSAVPRCSLWGERSSRCEAAAPCRTRPEASFQVRSVRGLSRSMKLGINLWK